MKQYSKYLFLLILILSFSAVFLYETFEDKISNNIYQNLLERKNELVSMINIHPE